MPPKKAPLGDCTDALVSVEPGFASMGRGHMRAVRMDNPEKNATRVAYFLLPPGAVDDRPATVPEGATYWWKKKSALDPMSGGSRWSAQPGGDQGGQDSRCGQELARAMASAFLGQAATSPTVRCRPPLPPPHISSPIFIDY